MRSTRLLFILLVITGFFISSCDKNGRWSYAWEQSFEEFQPTEIIIDSMGVEANMHIAEIGAGNGRFIVNVAKRLTESGKVYANDIDPKAIRFMKRRIKKEAIPNMEVIFGEITDPLLPAGKMDIVFMINTYEHLDDPVNLLKNIIPALKKNGLLIIIATDPEKINYAHSHSVNWQTIMRDAKDAGYAYEKIMTFLPRDNIYFFKPKPD